MIFKGYILSQELFLMCIAPPGFYVHQVGRIVVSAVVRNVVVTTAINTLAELNLAVPRNRQQSLALLIMSYCCAFTCTCL